MIGYDIPESQEQINTLKQIDNDYKEEDKDKEFNVHREV